MSVRRGPTEHRRSEGTLTKSGPNQEQMVLVTFPERKVTRRGGGKVKQCRHRKWINTHNDAPPMTRFKKKNTNHPPPSFVF